MLLCALVAWEISLVRVYAMDRQGDASSAEEGPALGQLEARKPLRGVYLLSSDQGPPAAAKTVSLG
jgi:hypothetical protein